MCIYMNFNYLQFIYCFIYLALISVYGVHVNPFAISQNEECLSIIEPCRP